MKNKKTKYTLIILIICVAILGVSALLFMSNKENLLLKSELQKYTIKKDFSNLNSKIELVSSDLANMDIELEQLIDLREELNDCLNSLLEVEKTIYTIEQLENVKDMEIVTDINIKMICNVDFVNYCNGLMEEICNDFSNDTKNDKVDFGNYIGEFYKLSAIIDNYVSIIDEEYIDGEYENIRQTVFLITDYNKANYINIPQDQRLINNLDGQ